MTKRISDSGKSLSLENVSGFHEDRRTVGLERFHHRITVINVQMHRYAGAPKARWTWRATVFRKFFAEEESRVANAEFTVHHTTVWHFEQEMRRATEHAGVKLDRFFGVEDTEVRDELAIEQ